MKSSNKVRNYHALTHASAPIIGLVGGMTFLGPLVMWLAFKNEYPSVESHAKKALNFHITMIIASILSLILLVIGMLLLSAFATRPNPPITLMIMLGIPVAGLIGLILLQFVTPIVMAFKAYNGRFKKYPLAYPFFKPSKFDEFVV